MAAATVAMIEKISYTPWFISCIFTKPHDPYIAPQKYLDLYPPDSLRISTDPAGTKAVCACTRIMDAQLERLPVLMFVERLPSSSGRVRE